MNKSTNKIVILFLCFVATALPSNAQNAKYTWDSIKSNTSPVIAPAFQNEYDKPYKQPLADYGWEDGLQISRDGLNLYALYAPMDFLSWMNFFSTNLTLPLCSLFANMSYIRNYAKTYGMDLVTNPFGCDSFVNIDILYAHRKSLTDNFTNWQLSGIARGGAIEGSPAPLSSEKDTALLDLFFFTGNNDIWMIKETTNNPSGINTAIRLPNPINPNSNEFNADNPFVERINADTLLLIYEKYSNAEFRTFMYVLSNDAGTSWSVPQAITTITNSLGHIEHPHLYKDQSNQWWLYFSIDYTVIVRSKQNIAGNWDSWAVPEIIISKGNAISIGEPSVTKNGDISFCLAYKNTVLSDSTDVYDLDPWFLPHKSVNGIMENAMSQHAIKLNAYPNPFSDEINIDFFLLQEGIVTLEIISLTGGIVQTLLFHQKKKEGTNSLIFNTENLPAGVYLCKIKTDHQTSNKLIIKQ